MAGSKTRRPLSPEEQSLWRQLTQSVRSYRKHRAEVAPPPPAEAPTVEIAPPKKPKGRVPPTRPAAAPPAPPPRAPVAMLDRSWEKRIRGGQLQPEMSVDLHGHNLAGAHGALNMALTRALADGVRTLLVVTGKPRPGRIAPEGRGAIRAEIGDWLERSPYADRIASVRIAHPRHGGDGALYVILRRAR